MAVYVGSRYEQSDITNVQVGSGKYNVVLFGNPPHTDGIPYTVIIATSGVRFDQLAYQILGDARKWWVIADMNPEIDDLFHIPMGALLRVPIAPLAGF